MADSDLTTAATVAGELGVDPSTPRLPRIITAASAAIRSYLNRRQLHYQVGYVENVAVGAFQPNRLWLELTPVASIASVVVNGVALGASDYALETSGPSANAAVYRSGSGWPYTGWSRGGPVGNDPNVGSEQQSIVVTYTGGWVTPAQATLGTWAGPARSLPEDLEQAAIETIVSLWRTAGTDRRVMAETFSEYSVTYAAPTSADGGIVPPIARGLLDPYRRLT